MKFWRDLRIAVSSSVTMVSLGTGALLLSFLLRPESTTIAAHQAAEKQTTSVAGVQNELAVLMGVSRGDCKKCHPSEVAAWMKTAHFQSADTKLFNFRGNTQKYADALGIREADLLNNSLCANCHASKAMVNNRMTVISGVSCESCHGSAGGNNGWLNRHQSYHESMPVPRLQETATHRQKRIEHCESKGMVRSSNVYGLAKKCFGCHIVGNEKLVAAGHKAASVFEFVSWSGGEVRHNFLLDKTKNAQAPTLWMDHKTDRTAVNRKRVKFVTGTLVQIETALRRRAEAKNPSYIPQMGALIAAANGKLAEMNALAGTAETQATAAVVTPLMATLFFPQPTDADIYTAAANKVAEQAKKFVAKNDGSRLQTLDAIIKRMPPHYSQQHKKKYLSAR